ncbi:MAG: exo-alpha-sialidase [Solirubrobacteraceae bacterium]|nr:exo-alpha-sialidase [Solirubrobacteraceae bacterium]
MRLLLPLLTGLVLSLAPAAHGATFEVGTGRDPEVVADPDGTAYVAWHQAVDVNTTRVYACRVAPGAGACDRMKVFTFGGQSTDASILRDPGTGEIIVVIQRSFSDTGGPANLGTFISKSGDQGQTWSAPTRIATGQEGDLGSAVFGPGAFRITTLSDYASVNVQSAALAGGTAAKASNMLSENALTGQLASIAGDSILLAQRDTGRDGALRWRRFSGSADPNVGANWTAEQAQPGILAEGDLGGNGLAPVIAAGFEGETTVNPLVVRRYDAGSNSWGGATTVIGTAPGAVRPYIDLDAASNAHLFYLSSDPEGDGRELRYLSSADGATWPAKAQVLDVNDSAIDVASAAGLGATGAAAWETQLDGGANARIRVANIGGPAAFPPDPPAPGQPAPPAPPTCSKAPRLGIAQLIALTDCFAGNDPKLTIKAAFLANGVRVDPKGKTVKIDTSKRTVELPAGTVVTAGPVTLAKGERTWTFPKTGTYPAGGILDLDKAGYGGELAGLRIVGDTQLTFIKDEVRLATHLTLPSPFSGLTADITLRANNQVGLRLDGLSAKVATLPYGFKKLEFDYVADPPTWRGSLEWSPPVGGGDTYGGTVEVVDGELTYLRVFGRFAQPGKKLYPPYLFMPFLGFELKTKPQLQLQGQTILTGGPVGGIVSVGRYDAAGPPAEQYGTVTATLADPFKLDAIGPVYVFGYKLGQGYLKYRYPLDIGFGANAQIGNCGFGPGGEEGIGAGATFDGYLTASKSFAFSLSAAAKVCFGIGTQEGSAVLSSKGVAACAEFGVGEPVDATISVGAGHYWSDPVTDIDLMFKGCDTAPYAVASPLSAQAAQAGGFNVGGGLKQLNVQLTGAGGPPIAAVVAPDGRRYEASTSGAKRFPTHFAYLDAADGTQTFLIPKPLAGRWTVVPADGSPAVTKVELARDAPSPAVRGSVRRAGSGRELRWQRPNDVEGEDVTFVAEGGGTLQRLGTARRGAKTGTLRFRPKYGPGGRRTVYAVVDRGGLPAARLRVATFVVPPPPPVGTARRLKAVHRGSTVRVTWRPGRAVVRQELRITLGDGTRKLVDLGATRRSFTLTKVRAAVTGRVRLTGYDRAGKDARAATATVRAAKTKRR